MSKELLDQLIHIQDNPALLEQVKANIPMVNNNGYEVVDPEFIKEISEIDPLDLASKMLDVDQAQMSAIGLFHVHFKNVLMLAISQKSQDFSSDSVSFEEYVNRVRSLGFVQIAETEKESKYVKDETTLLMWHPEHSMIWEISSYRGKASGTTLYFQGVKRDPNTHHNLSLSTSIRFNTDVYVCSCDMRDIPMHLYFSILEKFQPVKHLVEVDISTTLLNKVADQIPTDILDLIVGYNMNDRIVSIDFETEQRKAFVSKVEEIINEMTLEEKSISVAVSRSYEFTSIETDYASSILRTKLEEHGISGEVKRNYITYINEKLNDSVKVDPMDCLISHGVEADIKPLYEYLSVKKEQGRLSEFTNESDFNKLAKKVA